MPKAAAHELICLRANPPQFDPAKGEDGLPQRILVLAWGEHNTTKGKVVCNATTMAQLPAYNASQNWDRPPLDFEHSSVPGSPTYKGEPCAIAGYGTLQLVAGEGIYLQMTSWTPDGVKYASEGHYGDLSPVVKVNERNEVIGLHSAALCRHGATPGLVFLSAALGAHPQASDPSPSNAMPKTPEELAAALAKLLGLAETATPEEILSALTTKLEGDKTALADATKAKGEAERALSAAGKDGEGLKLLTAELKTQGESLKALTTQLEASQRGEILAQAAREGKVVPKIAQSYPVDQLKALCAELPVTVPMDQRTVPGALMLSTTQGETAEQKAVSSLTGVSEEDRKKYA